MAVISSIGNNVSNGENAMSMKEKWLNISESVQHVSSGGITALLASAGTAAAGGCGVAEAKAVNVSYQWRKMA